MPMLQLKTSANSLAADLYMQLYGKLQVDRFPTIFFLPEIYISAVYIYVGFMLEKLKCLVACSTDTLWFAFTFRGALHGLFLFKE